MYEQPGMMICTYNTSILKAQVIGLCDSMTSEFIHTGELQSTQRLYLKTQDGY